MLCSQEAPIFDPSAMKKKKPKKAVAFTGSDDEGANGAANGDKGTAESHSIGGSPVLCLPCTHVFPLPGPRVRPVYSLCTVSRTARAWSARNPS